MILCPHLPVVLLIALFLFLFGFDPLTLFSGVDALLNAFDVDRGLPDMIFFSYAACYSCNV